MGASHTEGTPEWWIVLDNNYFSHAATSAIMEMARLMRGMDEQHRCNVRLVVPADLHRELTGGALIPSLRALRPSSALTVNRPLSRYLNDPEYSGFIEVAPPVTSDEITPLRTPPDEPKDLTAFEYTTDFARRMLRAHWEEIFRDPSEEQAFIAQLHGLKNVEPEYRDSLPDAGKSLQGQLNDYVVSAIIVHPSFGSRLLTRYKKEGVNFSDVYFNLADAGIQNWVQMQAEYAKEHPLADVKISVVTNDADVKARIAEVAGHYGLPPEKLDSLSIVDFDRELRRRYEACKPLIDANRAEPHKPPSWQAAEASADALEQLLHEGDNTLTQEIERATNAKKVKRVSAVAVQSVVSHTPPEPAKTK